MPCVRILLLRMVLIEVWLGRQRPSQWFRDAEENFVLQWAGFGIHPARSTWYAFRDRQGPFIDDWLRQVFQTARERGARRPSGVRWMDRFWPRTPRDIGCWAKSG